MMRKNIPERQTMSQEQLSGKIKEVAQRLYEKRGRAPGHELDDWLEAERIVKKTCR
jgi:hypothetical protein